MTRHRQSEINALKDGADASYLGKMKTALMEETRTTFKELLAKFPDCAEGWALFGQILLDDRQFAAADELFQKALEVSCCCCCPDPERQFLVAEELFQKVLEVSCCCPDPAGSTPVSRRRQAVSKSWR